MPLEVAIFRASVMWEAAPGRFGLRTGHLVVNMQYEAASGPCCGLRTGHLIVSTNVVQKAASESCGLRTVSVV